jgi:2-methylcitrate dehydratase PrpD
MTTLLHLASQARALRVDDAPAGVRVALRRQRLGQIAAAAGGRSYPGATAILDLLGCGPTGSHPLLPGLAAPTLPDALEAAATLSSAWGEDDVVLPARVGPLAWTAMLGAADLGRGWDVAERAQAVGVELAARLSGCTLGSRRPLRSPGLVLAFGSAAAAGILLDLPEPKLAHALALAVARAPLEGSAASRTGARLLGPGRALRLGWDCARLAERGLEGDLDALDGDLLEVLGGGRALPGWWSGLGQAWLVLSSTTPSTPGSPFLAPALAALDQLRADVLHAEDRRLQPADVLRIDVDVALPTAAMELQLGRAAEARYEQDASPSPASFLHSVSRGLALALAIDRSPGIDDLRPGALARSWPGARDVSRRVHVRHDWRLTLSAWEALRQRVAVDRLMEGVGPSALFSAALRVRGRTGGGDGVSAAGPPGGGAGMAWSELPLALAAERLGPRGAELSDELIEDPAGTLGKGLEKLAGWASRRVERLLDAEGGAFARIGGRLSTPRRGTLEGADLEGMALPIPARVRVLENGGRVWEAEVTALGGLDEATLGTRCASRLGGLAVGDLLAASQTPARFLADAFGA